MAPTRKISTLRNGPTSPRRIKTLAYLELDDDGEPLTAQRLRDRGLQRERDGQIERRYGSGDGEATLRSALADLVNAFLTDRRGQADLFARAHRFGHELSRGDGCRFSYDPEEIRYTIRCPIFALHRPVAHSVSWTLLTECSICGAEAFGCDHLGGQEYDGKLCEMKVAKIADFGHVAFTANPDFLYTWHQPQQLDAEELLARGRIERLGETLSCPHCQGCRGSIGPTEGDLDPIGRWQRLVAENTPPQPVPS